MKTKLIGIFAVAIAFSLSFFTAPKSSAKPQTSYDWFKITDGIALGAQVPQADASYLGSGTTAPVDGCSTMKSNQCVSGFNSSQVNASNQLKDNHQAPAQQPYTQN